MPLESISESLGGGLLGLFGVLIVIITVAYWRDLRGQISEGKEANRELRSAINRLADTIESWTPENQRRRVPRP